MRLQYGFIVRAHFNKNVLTDPSGDQQFGQLTLFFALAPLRDSSRTTLILIVLAYSIWQC